MVCGFLAAAIPATAQNYDLVILDGRVMDPETMYDGIANVGIRDGRIAAITKEPIDGEETINAKGLVVAPGFIDTHFHAVDPFATKLAVAGGVTTGMDLEAGAEFHTVKEKVLLAISEIVRKHDAEIAFPTSTVHIPDGIDLTGIEKQAGQIE